ncbi:hypothetical protein PO80_02485 [Vibrio parahaemolyticus]|uniref:hypothetical protein n=1 Tax=Vibrio parahaemolyticus TaxID=670 RepID=UPI000542A45F|nr:hypothetical protein [Vibrio parahaemolyticus]ELU8562249.1 hypothetical protein [Vibrio parahaemolyticus]KHF17365.1 hypothetical protein PO80_02485 [Vibrio parahaemolyticus]OTV96534.1 hypothetical protein BA739_23155 [Vibrio parahaemolyticus]OTW00265.1 hypothetical protein BA740_23830 [Vibrio parahaemolyticus]
MEEDDINLVLNQVKSNLIYPELFPLVKVITLKCIRDDLEPEYVLNDILVRSQDMNRQYYLRFLSCCQSKLQDELVKDDEINCEELESCRKVIDSLILLGLHFYSPGKPVLMISGLIEYFEQVYCLYVEGLIDSYQPFKRARPAPLPTGFLEYDKSVMRSARLCFWMGLEDELLNLIHQWMSLGKQSGLVSLQRLVPKICVMEREVMLGLFISDYN